MAELPVLPLKTDALLADTTHMSPEEFGVYCRLLFVMWRQGARLVDDDTELATIGGVPLARWRKIKEKVMRPMTVGGGMVSQKRLTDTWMNVQEVRRKRAGAADRRWGNKPRADAMQMHNQMECRSNANQIPKVINTSLEDRPSDASGMQTDARPVGLAEDKTRFRLSGEALIAIGGVK